MWPPGKILELRDRLTYSVADPDPGSGAFLAYFGSQSHIFDSLMTNFWAKSTIILSVLAKKNVLFKNNINTYNFMIFVATKKW
jgi:hypothetical protein